MAKEDVKKKLDGAAAEFSKKLRNAPPPAYAGQADELARGAGRFAGPIADIVNAGLEAGLPWGKLLGWLAGNLQTVLALFNQGLSVDMIVKLIASLFGIFNPDTPEPQPAPQPQ